MYIYILHRNLWGLYIPVFFRKKNILVWLIDAIVNDGFNHYYIIILLFHVESF